MKKRIIALGVLIMMSIGLFAGCGGDKIEHNAELLYNAQALMDEDYLESNMTLGAYLPKSQVDDTSSPPTRTYIIKDKSTFDLTFNEFPQEIDFSEKMILVYFFTSSYPTGPYKLERANMNENDLLIDFKLSKSDSSSTPNAARPQQTCIVVLIDNLDIGTVTFKQK